MKQRKTTLLFLAVLVALGLVALIAMQLLPKSGQTVTIRQGGEVYGTYSLSERQTIRIDLEDGEYNIVEIADGTVCMLESTCSNQICVNSSPLSADFLGVIVCLPHELIVEISD